MAVKPARVLVADPPWDYIPQSRSLYSRKKDADKDWFWSGNVLNEEQLKGLKLPSLHKEDAICFLWTPAFKLPSALAILQAWGFKHRGQIIWVKTKKDGTPSKSGMGFWQYITHEICLIGIRDGSCRPRPDKRLPSVIAHPPLRNGGGKPEVLQYLIEQSFPGPYTELFARRKRKGWRCYGNEL